MSQVYRICLNCDEVFLKNAHFTKDKWKCNACFGRNAKQIVPPKPTYRGGGNSMQTWQNLFNYIDVKSLGRVTKQQIQQTLQYEFGEYTFPDDNGSAMDFDAFMVCVNELPADVRVAARQCADSVKPGSKYKASANAGRRRSSTMGDAMQSQKEKDQKAYGKLFMYLDEDGSGNVSLAEIKGKMTSMLGNIEWEDTDGDDNMDYDEFIGFMERLPPSTKLSAISWADAMLDQYGRRGSVNKASELNARVASFQIERRASVQSNTSNEAYAFPAEHVMTEEEREGWWKFFWYLDQDQSGSLGQSEVAEKMSQMLGPISWTDMDGDGQMDFEEFCRCMGTLKRSTQAAALAYAQQYF